MNVKNRFDFSHPDFKEVSLYWDNFKNIKVQTPELCEFAISKDWRNLAHVVNQTEFLCTQALNNSLMEAFSLIKVPTPEMVKKVALFNSEPRSYLRIVQDPKWDLIAIEANPKIFTVLPNNRKTKEVVLKAISLDGKLIKSVSKVFQTEEICLAAIKTTPMAIQLLNDKARTLVVVKEAVKLNPHVVNLVKFTQVNDEIIDIALTLDHKVFERLHASFQTPERILYFLEQGGRENCIKSDVVGSGSREEKLLKVKKLVLDRENLRKNKALVLKTISEL